jgi:hypothetical protein
LKEGYYKDSANTIKHGQFRNFYANGQLQSIKTYDNNKREGRYFSFYPNGMMRDSFYFKMDIPYGYCVNWYPSGDVQTEMQMDSTGNGSGLVIGFFEQGNVSFKGKIGKGLRKAGNWFYYHQNGQKASVLQYPKEDSAIISWSPQVKEDLFESTFYDSTISCYNTICYDINGIQQDSCHIKNKTAEFPKGLKGWTGYLEKELVAIMPRLSQFPGPVTYKAYFTVETDGRPVHIMLDNKIDASFDREVYYIFSNSKKWIPAEHNNRLIPVTHIQSLTLGVR